MTTLDLNAYISVFVGIGLMLLGIFGFIFVGMANGTGFTSYTKQDKIIIMNGVILVIAGFIISLFFWYLGG